MVSLRERVVNAVIRALIKIAFRLEASDLAKLPQAGPGLLVANHTSYLEGPIIYVLIRPRQITAIAKRELWSNPLTRFFMNTWHIIPISRGRVDSAAMQAALQTLEEGRYLGIAAEGTRSKTGKLGKGHPGATFLATAKNVPIYPVAQWGLADLGENLKRLRRTPLTIRVGAPFHLRKPDNSPITSRDRRKMIDEIMYQLALLMPEELRGHYTDLSQLTTEYLDFRS